MVLDGVRIMRWREEDERGRGGALLLRLLGSSWVQAGLRFFCTVVRQKQRGSACVSACACECVLIRFVEVQIRLSIHPSRSRRAGRARCITMNANAQAEVRRSRDVREVSAKRPTVFHLTVALLGRRGASGASRHREKRIQM